MQQNTQQAPRLTVFGRLAPESLERAYLDDAWPAERSRVAFVGLITGIAYLSGIYIDYLQLGIGTPFYAMATVRLIVSLVGVSVFLLALPSERNRLMTNVAFTLYMLSVMFGESMELVVKGEMAITSGISPTVVIALFYFLFLPPSPIPPIIGAVVGGGTYLLTMAARTSAPSNAVVVNFLFFVLVICFGIYFVSRYGKSRRREYLAYLEIKAMSEIDELTGVLNRRKLLATAAQQLSLARRQSTALTFMMLDLDDFKKINDTWGHQTGDEALREFTRRVIPLLEHGEKMGRIGGEEFVVIMPEKTARQACSTGNAIMSALNMAPVQHGRQSVQITSSIGIASATPATRTVDELIGMADNALYNAKSLGKNRQCVYDASERDKF